MRVLIADDHDLIRDMLVRFLGSDHGMETVTAQDLDEALRVAEAGPPFDVVLLDYSMPGMNGLSGLGRMREIANARRVAIISGTADRSIADEALKDGADGFLPKTLSASSLVNAIRFIAMGEKYAPIDFMRSGEAEPVHPLAEKLSSRELDMLRGLAEGKSNKEIARDLDLREPTVKLHMKTLYRKLGASNRTQAALIAKNEGLF